ncbi:MAG TPA: glycosyltransferase, partial [Longimicrobiales bacterium]|nr:glycosyltransferase [Longimicrobiales bacterium]
MNLDPRPPAVTHLLAPAHFGGLESVVSTLAAGQVEAGHRVQVAVVLHEEEPDHPFLARLAGAGLATETLVVPVRGYLAERRAVRATLRAFGSRVLHTHGYRPDVVDGPVARGLGLGSVTTVHGFTTGRARNRLYEHLQRRAYRRFDAVTVVSETLREDLVARGVPPERIHVVRNAWRAGPGARGRAEAREALGLAGETGARLGWIGRMTPEKGPDVMVRALARCGTEGLRLSMVGEGRMRSDLVQLAEELGVGERITWHGAVTEAGDLVAAFDLVVLSSWTEGTPMVLLEAMAAGVPVVATAVGGIP